MIKVQNFKKYLLAISSILIVFSISLNLSNPRKEVVHAEGVNSLSTENFSRDSIIVVLDEEISGVNKLHNKDIFAGVEIEAIEDLTRNSNNLSFSKNNFRQILKIELVNDSRENVLSSIEKLRKLDFIASAEPNYYYDLEMEPSDYYYEEDLLWGLNNSNGIQAPLAWNITRGSSLVRVGVLDSGIANHEDLNANLVEGYDSFNNNSFTKDDISFHGTHVAGTIGAVGNNNIGVVGVNWNVQLVPLQATNENNEFISSDVIKAIAWATSKWGTSEQIDIINFSVSGLGTTTSVREAVRNYPGLFVWAAGNRDIDIDGYIEENGTFDLANIISVGAIKENGERPNVNDWGVDKDEQPEGSTYSASGQNVNIYAPGQSIFSTGHNNTYEYRNGTSMAAPHVAGVAALMLSVNPNLTSAELKSAILANADTLTITIPDENGGTKEQEVKKLNAFKAVSSVAFQTNAQGNCITGLNFEPTGELEIPSVINGVEITSIATSAFANQTQLTNVTLPETITSIGDMAFSGCISLSSINTSEGLKTIGEKAFNGCTSLSSINILEGLETIGDEAFNGCISLRSVYISAGLETIGCKAFNGCISLSSINISEGLKTIGEKAFNGCTLLSSINILEGLETIGDEAFNGCIYLSSIYLPAGLETIGCKAFNDCHNLNINISELNDNFEIEDNILYNESKTKIITAGETPSEITIPATVNEIEDYAFNGNLNLHTVKIYGSPSIGAKAFYECANLDNVYFYSFTVPEVVGGAFANNFFRAHVPYNLQNTYSELFNEERIDVVPISITATLMVDDITYQTINTYYGETISFIEPTKDGYTFMHWVDEQGNVYENGGVWDRAENLIVQAVWEPKGYAINFAGYGSANLESKFVLYGMPIGELPTPTRTGYTFNGWKDENGVFYTADTVWLSTSSLTLTSDFSANQYTITYDGNGGTASIVSQNVYYLSVVDSLATATKLGFTFTGWNTQADGLGATIVAPYTYETANNVILYAQYTANVHGVSFDKQGGTGGSDGVNAIYNSSMPAATAPTKTGYTFNGYYSEPNGLGTKYYNLDMTSANVWDNDSNTTLYADWVANTYDVVLDMQGGSGGTVNILATYASAMPMATAPTRTGYTFNGYYSMPNGGGTKYYHLDMTSANIWNVAENTTLYANWTANTYTITFDTQGGSGGTVSTTATYDSVMPSAIAPTKVGYTFFGYFTSPNGAGTQIYNEFMVSSHVWDITSNTTLYAFWVPIQYEIVFNTAGGSGGTSSILASYGCAMPMATAPTKTGYVFLGYYTSTEGAGVKYYEADMSSARNWDITSGTTLYAYWRGQYFNINYKNLIFLDHTADVILDENETKDAPTYFEYGKGFNLNRATASWQKNDGVLVFLGWYTNMNFTTKVTTISKTRKAPIDVYAKWRYDFNRNSRYGAYYITDEDPYTEEYRDTITLELNINNLYQELTSIGINYVFLEFKLKIREVDDGYQEVSIYKSSSPTSNPIWTVDDIDHYPPGTGTTPQYYIWECAFSIDDLRDCRYLYVRYGANGAWGDDWVTDEIHVDVMYTVTENSEEDAEPFSLDYNVPVADESCTPLESVSESY